MLTKFWSGNINGTDYSGDSGVAGTMVLTEMRYESVDSTDVVKEAFVSIQIIGTTISGNLFSSRTTMKCSISISDTS